MPLANADDGVLVPSRQLLLESHRARSLSGRRRPAGR